MESCLAVGSKAFHPDKLEYNIILKFYESFGLKIVKFKCVENPLTPGQFSPKMLVSVSFIVHQELPNQTKAKAMLQCFYTQPCAKANGMKPQRRLYLCPGAALAEENKTCPYRIQNISVNCF